MKRNLFFFLAFMLIYSSINAQGSHYLVDSHDWNGQGNMPVICQIQINGVPQESHQIELGAFIDGNVHGSQFISTITTTSASYELAYIQIYGNTTDIGKPITFKIFDHGDGEGVEYENYEITLNGETYNPVLAIPSTAVGTRKNPVILNFITYPSFTKGINAYTSATTGWYLISSPIGAVPATEVTNMIASNPQDYDLYYFDQSQAKEWVNYKVSDGNVNPGFGLVAGKGYLYANKDGNDLVFTGAPYTNSGVVNLEYDANATWSGVNLIGNPFTTEATLNRPYYRLYFDGSFEAKTENDLVEAMEGVIVRVDEAGEAEFTATSKRGNETTVIPQANITVRSHRGNVVDNAIIRFDGGAKLGKYQLFESNAQVCIPQNGRDYAVVNAGTQGELPLNFKATKNGNYTLNFNMENMTMDYLHLIDNLTGNDVDLLATPSYSFDAKTDDYASRFRVVFTTSNNNENQIAFISNGEIVINGVDGYTIVQVIDVNGRMICTANGAHRISTEDMAAGVYMIRLINGSDTKTQKIVVK